MPTTCTADSAFSPLRLINAVAPTPAETALAVPLIAILVVPVTVIRLPPEACPIAPIRRLIAFHTALTALRNNNSSKEGNSTWAALPYTPQQLREHLEAQFEEGMTWDNYGEWHIDHIYPQSKLPYESMTDENFRLAWDLRNLRPLWAAENLSKRDKIIEGAEELLLEIKKDL